MVSPRGLEAVAGAGTGAGGLDGSGVGSRGVGEALVGLDTRAGAGGEEQTNEIKYILGCSKSSYS